MSQQKWRGFSGSVVFGLIAIGIGIVYLLKSLGYIAEVNLASYWPLILIVFGLLRVIYPHSKSSYFWGPLLIVTGGLFMAQNLQLISFKVEKLWPVLPILFGIKLILRPVFYKPGCEIHGATISKCKRHERFFKGGSIVNDEKVDIALVLSGGEYLCTGNPFKGGTVSLTLSGCELDLSQVKTDLDEIFLDVNILLGGIEIKIPSDWTASFLGTPVLGSFENNTRTAGEPAKRLVIRGSITLAGVEVRN